MVNIDDGRNINEAGKVWDNGGIAFNENTNTYSLVKALLAPNDRIDDNLEDIYKSRYINTATGSNLDKLGHLVNLPRKYGEGDDKYRARIKVQFRVGTIGTTFDEFAEFTASLLNTDLPNITFDYNYGSDPATIFLYTDASVYDNSALTRSETADFLKKAVPAGHNVKAQERGTFRLKSDGETDDATKGLTSDSTSEGGTLAADIE